MPTFLVCKNLFFNFEDRKLYNGSWSKNFIFLNRITSSFYFYIISNHNWGLSKLFKFSKKKISIKKFQRSHISINIQSQMMVVVFLFSSKPYNYFY